MPIYEYHCSECDNTFELLRPKRKADDPVACRRCEGSQTSRKISLFAACSNGKVLAGGGGGCAGCTPSGGCASCGSR